MAKIYDLSGNVIKEIELPKSFSTEIRPDIIKRAVLTSQSNRRQPYGPNKFAGKRTSAHYHGARHSRHSMMNRELARMPRTHGGSPQQSLRARFVPQSVGGRRAHPPKPEKIWKEKINKKERRLAIKSAIAASIQKDLVLKRGHKFELDLPLIVVDDLEKISKTKDLKNVLLNLKLENELERAKKKKIRAGKGKRRGRKYKKKKSLLIVVKDYKELKKASKNLSGVDISTADNLNAELLAPGTQPGRLILWSVSAIEELDNIFKV